MIRFAFLFLLLFSTAAVAVEPDEMLQDPVLEARARALSKNLRCLVCQGEDIDESNAGLAADIRKLLRERLKKGDSDAAAVAYLQERYGDYILMRPPLKPSTALLWLAPLLVLTVGGLVVFVYVRRQQQKGGA